MASISAEKASSSQSSPVPLGELRSMSLRSPFGRNPKPSFEYGDRFIPVRSSMDFDLARCLLTRSWKKENTTVGTSLYQKVLAETLSMNRTRIFSFKSKPREPVIGREFFSDGIVSLGSRPTRQNRTIPQSPVRILDAADFADDYHLNLLDWGNSNVLAIALGNAVYLWDAANKSVSELMHVDEESGPITSVNWALDGQHIAIGLNSSDVQLWDSGCGRLLRTLRGMHRFRVGSLAWNKNILTTGGFEGNIVNNDVRIRSHVVNTFRGHQREVCELKWSSSGRQLASGGNDKLVYIWDLPTAASNPPPSRNQWLHRLQNHTDTVKALAWCPFQGNLLASGGGGGDRCIKFWNTRTGACLNSIDTGSQVCSLLWSKHERELLSSHGFAQNQMILWKYPSMVKTAELRGDACPVLFMAQSPDGCTIASAGGEELRFWDVFGTTKALESAAKTANTDHCIEHEGEFPTFCFKLE